MAIEVRPLVLNFLPNPTNRAQTEYLHSFCYKSYFIGGRGSGKTYALVAKNSIVATAMRPDGISYLTEQTGPDVRDILLPIFKEVVPPDLYKIRTLGANTYDILWLTGHETRLRSRKAKTIHGEPPFRGPSACMIGHDEIALDKSGLKSVQVAEGMLRGGEGIFIHDFTSTPKKGWMYDYMKKDGLVGVGRVQRSADGSAMAFYGRTKDNAFNNDLDARLREEYSDKFASQELDANWVSLTGAIWSSFVESEWPNGNLHWHRYDPNMPYVLACDLGVKSAWFVIQRVPAINRQGYTMFKRHVDVVVAEICPEHGNSKQVIKTLDTKFGRPKTVIVGSDVNTRSMNDGTRASMLFSSAWPGVPIYTPTGHIRDKEVQYWATDGQHCNSFGQRFFTVSQHLESLEEGGRGILDMIRTDEWPEGTARAGSFFEKDKSTGGRGIEDPRDAMLYYCACMYPPEARKEGKAI